VDDPHAARPIIFDTDRQAELIGPVAVTGVRVSGSEALALLGSATMPASDIFVRREAAGWKINEVFGGPLQ
jgi:hypothetical protein